MADDRGQRAEVRTDETRDPRRHIELKGAQNVRDLGGYTTRDGRKTQWKRFLRSDGMHLLTEEDQQKLLEYGVGTVIDLRMTMETEATPNVFSRSTAVDFHHISLMAILEHEGLRRAPESGTPAEKFAHMYRQFLFDCRDSIGMIMSTLADAGDHVCIYHCAGGKDRTGVISAILLSIAGVPDGTIGEDYGLTALYPTKTKKPALDSPDADYVIDPMYAWKMVCPPKAMILTLQSLHEAYGSVEAYLSAAGLTGKQVERLRAKMLGGRIFDF